MIAGHGQPSELRVVRPTQQSGYPPGGISGSDIVSSIENRLSASPQLRMPGSAAQFDFADEKR